MGSRHTRGGMTINLRGSREMFFLAMETEADILLIQEHRVAGPGLPVLQAAAKGKGWHRSGPSRSKRQRAEWRDGGSDL